jgi:hypothetical protein
MSALSAIEAGTADEASTSGPDAAAAGAAQLRRHRFHLVTGPSRPGRALPGGRGSQLTAWSAARPQVTVSPVGPAREAQPAAPLRSALGAQPAAPLWSARDTQRAAPLRLTRRGQVVIAVLAVVLAAVVITIVAMAAPGGAQAANHGHAGAGYQGMRQIVVRSGQTLWSIAAKVEPSADPRLVISQIMTVNAMTSPVIKAGELLWVPR